MIWDSIIAQKRTRYPSELVVRFVARNYFSAPDRFKVRFLDIGSGAGANTWFLWNEGFHVTSLDSAPSAMAHIRENICDANLGIEQYDCIIDHNALCHIEKPPYWKIWSALAPKGKFFSVTPAVDTWQRTLAGKGYCRLATENDIRVDLEMFFGVKVGRYEYPDNWHQIKSLVIEASK